MSQAMFLIVRERPDCSPLFRALQDAGYDLTTTDSRSQAFALLFVMKSVAAVIVDQRDSERASFDLPRHLRCVRRDVPIVLLSHEPVSNLPVYIDACVSDQEPLENLVHVLDELAAHSRTPVGVFGCP
jgi:DNA-binding NtrC family response regulator